VTSSTSRFPNADEEKKVTTSSAVPKRRSGPAVVTKTRSLSSSLMKTRLPTGS
jgi:hypothetical protein